MPTSGSEHDRFDTRDEHDGPGGHIGLLRSPTPQCRDRIQRWLHAAVARGDKLVTVAVPPDLLIGAHPDEGSGSDGGSEGGIDLGALPVLTPPELRREARPARLVERALAEGYRGLGVLIWADGSIAAVSPQGHAAVETSLAALCREHPASVLCVYDRGGAGTRELDMAVAHHPDELRDQQAFVHHDPHRLALGGEFDLSNVDVLSTALRTLGAIDNPGDAPPAVPTLQVDLRQLEFLSVAAARTLDIATAGYRQHGGRVELHHPSPHLITLLHLLNLHRLPGLALVTGVAGN
jgi:STAS domain/MEDS: MEthanogen/methylotroph, DcmR Sensory domain